MDKPEVSEEEFIRLCNEELKKLPSYNAEMEIVAVQSGAKGAEISGYRLLPESASPGILAQVANSVKEKVDLALTIGKESE